MIDNNIIMQPPLQGKGDYWHTSLLAIRATLWGSDSTFDMVTYWGVAIHLGFLFK
jgi:hypothetical protein